MREAPGPAPGGQGPLLLSVVAPCLNEEESLDALVDRTLATFDARQIPGELLLVDDGSADGTWRAIGRRSRADPRVRGIQHAHNRGIEAAWRSGLGQASGELACLIDADLQNRPEDIASLLDVYRRGEAVDLVQAVRRGGAGRRLQLFSRALNLLLNTGFRMRLRDNKSGFVLGRRDVVKSLLEHRYRYRYFQSLIGVAAGVRGYRIVEVDTVFEPRASGQSFLNRMPLLVSVRIVWEVLKFRVETWRWRGADGTPVPQRGELLSGAGRRAGVGAPSGRAAPGGFDGSGSSARHHHSR